MVEWVLFVSEDESYLWVCMMLDWSSEFIAEMSGYYLWFCVYGHGRRLVGLDLDVGVFS